MSTDEIERLRAKLEAVQRTVESQHEEIAAAQAREAKLRKLLYIERGYYLEYNSDISEEVIEVLMTDYDDTALCERLKVERERVITLLDGIDKTEIEDESGWWETSTGAEFGAKILERIRALGD